MKIYNHTDVWMFEAKALQIIEQTATLRVPKPYYFGKDDKKCFLIMEYLKLTPHSHESQRQLGEKLAKMHMTKFTKPFGVSVEVS